MSVIVFLLRNFVILILDTTIYIILQKKSLCFLHLFCCFHGQYTAFLKPLRYNSHCSYQVFTTCLRFRLAEVKLTLKHLNTTIYPFRYTLGVYI